MKKLEGRTVLVVDDEEDLLDLMKEEFECAGAKVFTASNGIQAFDRIIGHPIDAVVSDIRMPGGDGMTLLLNAKKNNPDRPVVLLITGYTDHTHQQAYDAGAAAIFSKPCDWDELINAVHMALVNRRDRYVRKFERFATHLEPTLSFASLDFPVKGRAINLGRGGMFIAIESHLPAVGTELSFSISVAGKQVEAVSGTGICRWTRDTPTSDLPIGIGVEFSALSPETFDAIEALLKQSRAIAHIPIK